MKEKIMLPAVSVGLLVSGREATAGVVDFGLVAESLTVNATLSGNTATNTIGGFTLGGLTFVGSHLSDVIGGNTVGNILATLLGPQYFTLSFGFSGNGGATGNFTILPPATLGLVNNTVTTQNTIGGKLNTCTPAVPGTVSGCTPGNQAELTPYDPTGLFQSLEAAGILTYPPNSFAFSNGPQSVDNRTSTITLGTFDGTTYEGEEILTTDAVSASIPEPAGWSLAALGSALLAWWRRRR